MSQRNEYALSELSKSAPNSIISNRETADPNPFVCQPVENPPSQEPDPAAGNLLSNADEKQHSPNPHAPRDWLWEFTAWLLAAASLISLFVVLVYFNDKALGEWKSSISPSAVVAIVSQIGNLLVWLGTVFFGAFAQQSLQLPLRQHNVTDRAPSYIPQCLEYRAAGNPVSFVPRPATGVGRQIYDSVPDSAALAVRDGLLRQNVSPSEVTGRCSTGNCTWADYHTMRVCPDIIDVTPSIVSNRRKASNKNDLTAGRDYSAEDTKDITFGQPSFSGTILETYEHGDTLWIGSRDTADNQYEGTNTLIQFMSSTCSI
ncbi:MAG: hypothetical protein Q9170_003289 [Blastenia crenularia]